MTLLHHLAQVLGLADSSAGAKAKEVFRIDHPELEPLSILVRATEQNRFIVAIFYRGSMPIIPTPYLLCAVGKDLLQAHELPQEECAPYRIRNYR
jgi:hypothetical protein